MYIILSVLYLLSWFIFTASFFLWNLMLYIRIEISSKLYSKKIDNLLFQSKLPEKNDMLFKIFWVSSRKWKYLQYLYHYLCVISYFTIYLIISNIIYQTARNSVIFSLKWNVVPSESTPSSVRIGLIDSYSQLRVLYLISRFIFTAYFFFEL